MKVRSEPPFPLDTIPGARALVPAGALVPEGYDAKMSQEEEPEDQEDNKNKEIKKKRQKRENK